MLKPRLSSRLVSVVLTVLPVVAIDTTETTSDIQVTFVKDIHPGPASSDIRVIESPSWASLHKAGNREFCVFSANDGAWGQEPWISDGTEKGTQLLLDIAPGSASSNGEALWDDFYRRNVGDGGLTYFQVNGKRNAHEFWRTNGTPEGTEFLLKASYIEDWDVLENRFWFVVRQGNWDPSLNLLMSTQDFVDIQTLALENAPVDLHPIATRNMLLVTQYNATSKHTVVSKTANGLDFELFFDPQVVLHKNTTCSTLDFVDLPPHMGDDDMIVLLCRTAIGRDMWAVPLDDPGAARVLLQNVHDVGSLRFAVGDTSKHLYFTNKSISGTQVFRFDGSKVELVVEMAARKHNAAIRHLFFAPVPHPPSDQMLFFVLEETGPSADMVEFWVMNVRTHWTKCLEQWRGVRMSNRFVLSDHRVILVTANDTDKEFWQVGSNGLVHRVLHMDLAGSQGHAFATPYTHLNNSTLLFGGHDAKRGSELWKLTYEPRSSTTATNPHMAATSTDTEADNDNDNDSNDIASTVTLWLRSWGNHLSTLAAAAFGAVS